MLSRAQTSDRGRETRFVVFIGLILVAASLPLKSDQLDSRQTLAVAGGVLAVACLAVVAYLRTESGTPQVEHFVPAALGVLVVSGLPAILPQWWMFGLAATAFGLGFAFAARLDYSHLRNESRPVHLVVQEAVMVLVLAGAFLVLVTQTVGPPLNLPLRLAGAFGISFAATYRSFRVLGRPMSPRRAVLFSIFVAQLVALFAWAMTISTVFGDGLFAVMLLLLWYVNRGIIRHTVEETLSRNVIVEYSLFVLLIAYLYFISSRTH
jgi:hypothetical protein